MEQERKRYDDLTGRRFGMLVVQERAPKTKGRYAEWICGCDCGGSITVSSKKLKRGTVTNCGCVPKKTAGNGAIAEDLTGQTFGALTVLHRTENKGGRTCWTCRCECGRLYDGTAHDLKSGHVTSCGCGINRQPQYKDIRGLRSGRLRAVRPLRERTSKGSVVWECRCDCGNLAKASEDQILFLGKQSCGCKLAKVWQTIGTRPHRVSGTIIELLGEKKARSDSETQAIGVTKRGEQSYRADITLCKKKYYLGTYKTMEEAKQARAEGEQQLFRPVQEAFRKWNAYAETHPGWAEGHPLTITVQRSEQMEFAVLFGGLPETTETEPDPGRRGREAVKIKRGRERGKEYDTVHSDDRAYGGVRAAARYPDLKGKAGAAGLDRRCDDRGGPPHRACDQAGGAVLPGGVSRNADAAPMQGAAR